MNEEPPLIMDIRPLLQRGQEPFSEIMRAVARLGPDEEIILLAPFEPLPLMGVLSQQGYLCRSHADAGTDEWIIRIRRIGSGAHGREIDARMLAGTDVTGHILEECSTLGREESLAVVTHDFPSSLLETLPGHGFEGEPEQTTSGHWITRIWRNTHH